MTKSLGVNQKPVLAKVKKNIFNIIFVVFIIALILVTGFVYDNYKSRLLTASQNNFYEKNIALESSLNKGITFVSELESIANVYLEKSISDVLYDVYYEDLSEHLTYFEEADYHIVEKGDIFFNQEIKNSIFGHKSINDVDKTYIELLMMILSLQDLQMSAHDNDDSFALSYVYVESLNMSSLYPNVPIESIVANFDSFADVKPFSFQIYQEQNMKEDYFWTEPYFDRAGNGMMVTCSVPLYQNDVLIGVISVDIVLDFLNQYTEKNEVLPGDLFLVSEAGNIIASSVTSYEDTGDVVTYESYYADRNSNDYVEYRRSLSNVPWQYVYLIADSEVNQLVYSQTKLFIFAIVLIFVFICLVYLFIKKYYINPGIQAELDLIHLNKDLSSTKEELEESLHKLKKTQGEIIESEKLAALGTLVSGVAHEINTPLGICITTNSYINQKIKTIEKKMAINELSKKDLINLVTSVGESTDMVHKNLNDVAALIENFKLISSKQTYYTYTEFNLTELITKVIEIYRPIYKNTSLSIDVEMNDIVINSYERVFEQIISNLINNSIIHGFDDINQGEIKITLEDLGDFYTLVYSDNGSGISDELRHKIFEPFYTTKRAKGTGLGMFIIYNVIKEKLKGTIYIQPSDTGLTVNITWPKDPSNDFITAN